MTFLHPTESVTKATADGPTSSSVPPPYNIDERTNSVVGPSGASREQLSEVLLKEKGGLVDVNWRFRALDFSDSTVQDLKAENHHVHHIDIKRSLEYLGCYYKEDAWTKPYRYEILYILDEADGNYLKRMDLKGPVVCRRAVCDKAGQVKSNAEWKYLEMTMAYLTEQLAGTGKLMGEDGKEFRPHPGFNKQGPEHRQTRKRPRTMAGGDTDASSDIMERQTVERRKSRLLDRDSRLLFSS